MTAAEQLARFVTSLDFESIPTNNLRYCLAVGLHDGKVYVEQFDDAHLHDAAILATAKRVVPRPDAALGRIFESSDQATTHLEVTLKSGSRFELQVDYPRAPRKIQRQRLTSRQSLMP